MEEDFLCYETAEEKFLAKEDKLKLFKNIQKLDEKSRQVVYMRMIGYLNYEEIGEVLGKTSNWARVTFYRAKQKLKEDNENE